MALVCSCLVVHACENSNVTFCVRVCAGDAGSHIQLAGRERQIQGLSERLLCLTGSLSANVAAAQHILQILHMDPSGKYDNVSTSYRGSVSFAPRPVVCVSVAGKELLCCVRVKCTLACAAGGEDGNGEITCCVCASARSTSRQGRGRGSVLVACGDLFPRACACVRECVCWWSLSISTFSLSLSLSLSFSLSPFCSGERTQIGRAHV